MCQEWNWPLLKLEKNVDMNLGRKQEKAVLVLLKPSMASAMELPADTLEMCGLPNENIYMLAGLKALSAYRRENVSKVCKAE